MKIKFVKSICQFNSESELVRMWFFVHGSDELGPLSREYSVLPKYVIKWMAKRSAEPFSDEIFKDGSRTLTMIWRK